MRKYINALRSLSAYSGDNLAGISAAKYCRESCRKRDRQLSGKLAIAKRGDNNRVRYLRRQIRVNASDNACQKQTDAVVELIPKVNLSAMKNGMVLSPFAVFTRIFRVSAAQLRLISTARRRTRKADYGKSLEK